VATGDGFAVRAQRYAVAKAVLGRGRALHGTSPKEATASEHRVFTAQPGQETDIAQKAVGLLPVEIDTLPVDPRDLVVLAVGVVVAPLGASHLVTVRQHHHTLGQVEGGEEVADLAATQSKGLRVLGGALHTVVPRTVVVGAVP